MNAQTRRHLAEQAAMVAAQAEDPDSLISTIDQALREWGLEMAKIVLGERGDCSGDQDLVQLAHLIQAANDQQKGA